MGPEDRDRQSLMMHIEAVAMAQADPELIGRVQGILDRWCGTHATHHSLWGEWRRILR